ncbi:MAG: hypothetical protein IKN04_03325 [Clostridia bacterium]|nr:hypothetical protein [Clostridia bacterium]
MGLSDVTFYSHDGQNFKKIYGAKELSQAVLDTIAYHEQRAKEAIERANKTREEVAQEIKNEFAEENARLKEQLRFSVATLSSEKELRAYNDFVDEHRTCRLTKATGGMIPYVIQHGHGLGCCTTVYCQVCGASKNITDSSVW